MRPREPAVNETRPPSSSPGWRVMMLIAQHLDALDVGETPVLTDLAPEVDAVQVDADARIGRDQVVLQADAADEGVHRRRMAGGEAGHVEVRDELADVGQVVDALPLHGFRRERADRDRHFVDVLLAFLRRHDDGLEDCRFLRHGRLHGAQANGLHGAREERQVLLVHCETPLSSIDVAR
jgi:hypothetical protein